MDLKRKIELAEQHIRFISTADDTDSHVRAAALDKLAATIQAERDGIAARLEAKVAAELGKAPAEG
jgi:oligoendopeptidase F